MPRVYTTAHTPKPIRPIGSINWKGWKKIMDPQTGRVTRIDEKIPVSLDNEGKETHSRF